MAISECSSRHTTASPTCNIVLTQEQFQQLLEAAAGANVPANQTANVGKYSAPVVFVLSPTLLTLSTPIEFLTSEGTKLHKVAITSDVESASINAFNEVLMDRCIKLVKYNINTSCINV